MNSRPLYVSAGAVLVSLIVGTAAGCASRSKDVSAEPSHAIRSGERIMGAVDASAGSVTLRFRDRPLLVWSFATNQWKPYVREWHTLRGENVLLDAPADHLHHHGLMYAVRVNGVNFWEERPPAGRQVVEGTPVFESSETPSGAPKASIRQTIRWQPPGDDAPASALLVEQRVLTVTVDPGFEEVAVEWQSDFRLGPGTDRVVIHGADYNGLGLRLPPAFDRVAEFRNPAGLPYSEAQSWDVRPGAWTTVAGKVDGREVMVALASDPANAGISTFFSMRNAFAYLAATQSLGRQPLEYRRGDRFRLRYLAVAYPAHQNDDFIARRFSGFGPSR